MVITPGTISDFELVEERYLEMIMNVLQNDRRFGVLSLVEGSALGTVVEAQEYNMHHEGH